MKYKFNYKFIFLLLLLNFLVSIYFLYDFQIKDYELGVCDYFKDLQISINKYDLIIKYPSNFCDDTYYFNAVDNFFNIFNEKGNVYQNRPLYILSVSLIKNFINLILPIQYKSFVFIISFYIFQLILITITQFMILKIVNKFIKVNYFFAISISLLTMFYPLFRYEIFKTSNQTFSLLIFVFALYISINKNKITNFDYLILGFLFLFNRSFFISFIYVLLYEFTNLKYSISIIKNYVFKISLFFVPNFIFRVFMIVNQYDKYDVNAEYYGQFVWLGNYFVRIGNAISLRILNRPVFSYKNYESNLHCVSIPENFICFFNDSIITIKYLAGAIAIIIFFSIFSNITPKIKNNLLLITTIGVLFWSFIGWYPLIRLNLYTIGIGILLFSVFQVAFLKNVFLKIIYVLIWCFNFYNIVHWNVYLN